MKDVSRPGSALDKKKEAQRRTKLEALGQEQLWQEQETPGHELAAGRAHNSMRPAGAYWITRIACNCRIEPAWPLCPRAWSARQRV